MKISTKIVIGCKVAVELVEQKEINSQKCNFPPKLSFFLEKTTNFYTWEK